MAKREQLNVADYIIPLYMNGLYGRMLHLPAPANKKREILLVYGHHASIERMFGLAEDLNQYGAVTLPDLPGFGGMQSFYQIDEKPSLDNLADYLAAFIKLRYKRKRVTLMGMSFGFLVVTRMLQKYPELVRKVDMVTSIVGFVHHEDFKFKSSTYHAFKFAAKVFSYPIPAWIVRHIILRKTLIRLTYAMVADKHVKMKDADPAERKRRIDFEIGLWHSNDVRTYMDTSGCMLTVDLCNAQIDLPVYHIAVDDDRYFDNARVEQHMGIIYNKVHMIPTPMIGHAPTVIADAKSAAPFIPAKMRRLLRATS
jgi:pimeloyl-ACP methyl ester carboxylesterase